MKLTEREWWLCAASYEAGYDQRCNDEEQSAADFLMKSLTNEPPFDELDKRFPDENILEVLKSILGETNNERRSL